MSSPFACPQGHRWEASVSDTNILLGDPVTCPICGTMGRIVALTSPHPMLPSETPTMPSPDGPVDAGARLTQGSLPSIISVPGYEILRELGRGGMGVVYQARHLKLGRFVALKMILAGGYAGRAELARFKTEGEAIARLTHPNIVQVYEVGECAGKPFYSLEFCSGGSLDKKLNSTPLPPKEAAQLVETLARAMQSAHQAQVIHRDLKPANVLLTAEGTPKITDFGLAKKLDEAGQTQTGGVMGTPSYMAPEQAEGKKDVGPPADIYALGAILYECLTGRPPFKAATAYDTILAVVSSEPVPPRQLNAKVPADLETICLKCLHKDPARRYASAADLAEDLRRFQAGEPITARPVGKAERLWRWCRRNPVLASVSGTVGFALVAVVVLAILAAQSAQAVATAEKENAQKDAQRLQQALFEQARAERLLGNRFRALELLAEAANTGLKEDLRQEAIQAVTSSGVRFVREVDQAKDFTNLGAFSNLFIKQVPEYGFPEFGRDQYVVMTMRTDGCAELVVENEKTVRLPSFLGLPKKCCLSSNGSWLVFRDAKEPDLMRVWDCRLQQLHGRLTTEGDLAMLGHVEEINLATGIAFSPDQVLLASTHARAGEYVLLVNEIGSKRPLMARDGFLATRWSKDGRYLLTISRIFVKKSGHSGPDNLPVTEGGPGYTDPVKPQVTAAQIWEISCPVPTYQVREPVERLQFRNDGRLLAVNDTAWDVVSGNERIALRQIPLTAPGCLLGFREGEVWGLSPVPGSLADNSNSSSVAVGARHQRWCAELGATLVTRPFSLAAAPGAFAGIGNLAGFDKFANLGFLQWERPKVVRLLPVNQDFALTPPTDQRWNAFDGFRTEVGLTYSEPYRTSWSRDGTKLLAIVSVGNHFVHYYPKHKPGPQWGSGSVWGSGNRFLAAWDIPSGNRYRLTLDITEWKDIAWSPDGGRFATVRRNAVQVWDLATGTELATIAKEEFDRILWSNDGGHLLAVKQDKKAAVFTADGVQTWAGSADAKDWTAYGLSGEGRYVVSGGEDGLVHFLDVETGKEVARWQAHDAAVTALTFSPDGTLLVTGARDGTVRVWNLPWIRAELAKLGLDW